MPLPLNKILYFEDDVDIAMVAKLTLEAIGGFEVLHCASGQEALDALPSYDPQLVLVDVMMPQMDGMQTLANLRKMPEAKVTPVIFMTARAQTHEQADYLRLGALGVIVKPFDPMTLSDCIKDLWEHRDREHQSL
jgi:DNA-binding response OmpR family regulator